MRNLTTFVVMLLTLSAISLVPTRPLLAAHDSAYQAGYDQGFAEGYGRGYHDGVDGRRHHYHAPDGYDAYTSGLHDGRHAGYSAGYDDARQGRPNRFQGGPPPRY